MHNENLKHENDLLQEVEKFSLEELISHMLNLIALVERKLYLRNNPQDKGNGFFPRKLHSGSLTFNLDVPNTSNLSPLLSFPPNP
jgi:hypothetical protein